MRPPPWAVLGRVTPTAFGYPDVGGNVERRDRLELLELADGGGDGKDAPGLRRPPCRRRGHPCGNLSGCGVGLQRFGVQPMRRLAVCHTASCPWPGPTTVCAISCGSVSGMSLQVARSKEADRELDVPLRAWGGLDEPEPGRSARAMGRVRHGAAMASWRAAAR